MQRSLVLSLIGAASMAAALLVGCGDNDAKPVSSKAGQSCVRTADCADGLSCIANVCYSTVPVTGEAGSPGTTPVVGPVLGGEGESCTSRRDCETDLACFNQRCTSATSTGEGGASGVVTAQLGDRGESCRVNADCSTGLACVPSTTNSGGVCDLVDYGIKPTGKMCGGECSTSADCCQLPLFVQEAFAPEVKSCEDVTATIALNAVDCSVALTAGTLGARLCSADAAYCSGCSATTWKCTNNACVYNTACTVAAGTDNVKGCPTYTRLNGLVPACNSKTLRCVGATVVATGCTTDASCTGVAVADEPLSDTCSDGECTCYTANHGCYRKCARDLDCSTDRVCDTATSVCKPSDACSTDAQCATAHEDLDYKCNNGTCALSCATDRDCSPTGHVSDNEEFTPPFTGQVCGADGFCASVVGDCTDYAQCGVVGGLKTFCVARPAPAASTAVFSAISN
jgi:hypothetical protein